MSHHYYFTRIRNYVRQYIPACLYFILIKISAGRQPGGLHPILSETCRLHVVHADNLSHFVSTGKWYKCVLVLADNLTKYVRLEATKSTMSKEVIQTMENRVFDYGAPIQLITWSRNLFYLWRVSWVLPKTWHSSFLEFAKARLSEWSSGTT